MLNYKKAQWDQIEKDLTETYKQLKKDQDKMSLDELWNIFKTYVQETIHKHIPTKSIGNKSRLPWVNNQLKKLINKKIKLYKKKKRNPKYKEQHHETKTKLQNKMRNSYWRYIENMIFDIEINQINQASKIHPKNFILT